MTIDKMSLGKMLTDKVPVDKKYVDLMSEYKMSWY
jgi:hypothetical protein